MPSLIEPPAALTIAGFPVPEGLDASGAQSAAGLDWKVGKAEIFVRSPYGHEYTVPGRYAVVREDTAQPLGVVGEQYTPYQNEAFFGFMQKFCEAAGTRLDRCGALRGGRVVWCAAEAGRAEYVPGDPVRRWFVARNSHDGTSSLDITFTDHRMVCGNMLSATFGRARAVYHVRHTGSLPAIMREIGGALGAHEQHTRLLGEAMGRLAAVRTGDAEVRRLTRELLKDEAPDEDEAGKEPKAYGKILELSESGLGTGIPGVRGTAYGWVNAVTEYVDHHRKIRLGDRDEAEARFAAVTMGAGARMKQDAFALALKLAA